MKHEAKMKQEAKMINIDRVIQLLESNNILPRFYEKVLISSNKYSIFSLIQ